VLLSVAILDLYSLMWVENFLCIVLSGTVNVVTIFFFFFFFFGEKKNWFYLKFFF